VHRPSEFSALSLHSLPCIKSISPRSWGQSGLLPVQRCIIVAPHPSIGVLSPNCLTFTTRPAEALPQLHDLPLALARCHASIGGMSQLAPFSVQGPSIPFPTEHGVHIAGQGTRRGPRAARCSCRPGICSREQNAERRAPAGLQSTWRTRLYGTSWSSRAARSSACKVRRMAARGGRAQGAARGGRPAARLQQFEESPHAWPCGCPRRGCVWFRAALRGLAVPGSGPPRPFLRRGGADKPGGPPGRLAPTYPPTCLPACGAGGRPGEDPSLLPPCPPFASRPPTGVPAPPCVWVLGAGTVQHYRAWASQLQARYQLFNPDAARPAKRVYVGNLPVGISEVSHWQAGHGGVPCARGSPSKPGGHALPLKWQGRPPAGPANDVVGVQGRVWGGVGWDGGGGFRRRGGGRGGFADAWVS
jgi:hypothetical protein